MKGSCVSPEYKDNEIKKRIDPRELKGEDIIAPMTVDASLLWEQEVTAAKTGKLPMSECPHPIGALNAFQQQDLQPGTRQTAMVNLFACDACKRLLRIVDAHGRSASDTY